MSCGVFVEAQQFDTSTWLPEGHWVETPPRTGPCPRQEGVDYVDLYGETPLHVATRYGNLEAPPYFHVEREIIIIIIITITITAIIIIVIIIIVIIIIIITITITVIIIIIIIIIITIVIIIVFIICFFIIIIIITTGIMIHCTCLKDEACNHHLHVTLDVVLKVRVVVFFEFCLRHLSTGCVWCGRFLPHLLSPKIFPHT